MPLLICFLRSFKCADIKSSIVLELAKALNCTGAYLLEGNQEMEADDKIRVLLPKLTNERVREIVRFSEFKELALTSIGKKRINCR